MKSINDYLHLYIGCELFGIYYCDESERRGILTGVTNGGTECEIQFYLEDGINVSEEPDWQESNKVKLILRPLNSMTEEEDTEVLELNNWVQFDYDRKFNTPECFKYLLSKGFDLFGLIESGLAIEKTKELKTEKK